MEVTPPVLGGAGVTDVHLESLSLTINGRKLFLQTSPEYAMKRLLAAGSGPIYSLGPAFRGSEAGSRHNPEFTMLEWYRPGFDLKDLVAEVEDLLCEVIMAAGISEQMPDAAPPFDRVSYAELFQARYGMDPHHATRAELGQLAADAYPSHMSHIADHADLGTRADLLDLLFSLGVEPTLNSPTFVIDYPACQAALAQIIESDAGTPLAKRFELYWWGIELANGYLELSDAQALRARFEDNNRMRVARHLPAMDLDEKFLAAMPHLPPCSGVALGIDRLHMLVAGRKSIDEVLAFGLERL